MDIDPNWRNLVIPTRCFGSNPDTVLEMALAYMKGANEAGVACCMKHFPGDGCDDRDQHIVTTVNDCTCEEWDASYGKVYQGMIGAGVPSIMVGHIQQPAYSRKLRPGIRDEEIMPATVAPELLQGLLREKLGFNGLIITDATHMVGLTGKMRRSEFLPIAVQSGCDMILYYRDHDEDLRFMREGLESGQLTQERLDEAVLRVLAFKAMLRLHEKQRTNALMPAEEGLSVIGCPEHRAAAAHHRPLDHAGEEQQGAAPHNAAGPQTGNPLFGVQRFSRGTGFGQSGQGEGVSSTGIGKAGVFGRSL